MERPDARLRTTLTRTTSSAQPQAETALSRKASSINASRSPTQMDESRRGGGPLPPPPPPSPPPPPPPPPPPQLPLPLLPPLLPPATPLPPPPPDDERAGDDRRTLAMAVEPARIASPHVQHPPARRQGPPSRAAAPVPDPFHGGRLLPSPPLSSRLPNRLAQRGSTRRAPQHGGDVKQSPLGSLPWPPNHQGCPTAPPRAPPPAPPDACAGKPLHERVSALHN